MTTAKEALMALNDHFYGLTNGTYLSEAQHYSPELAAGGEIQQDEDLAQLGLPGLETETASTVLSLRPKPQRHTLNAYLACALTGLSSEQRQLLFHLSDTIANICAGLDINLYEPRKKTDPVHHADVSDSQVFHIDRERVVNSDLLIYLAHHPSTGSGEELDFAYNAMVPIIIITHSSSRVSRMVTGIPGLLLTISYEEPEELRVQLIETLQRLRPQLVQRKLSFGSYDVNIVGDRIRQLREAAGLTREDIATATSSRYPISTELLSQIEQSTDRVSNPSLVQLREIATALRTTVADLVEPDLNDLLLENLSTWVSDRKAARFGSISLRDRNKVLRRLLLRLIDNLEDEEG